MDSYLSYSESDSLVEASEKRWMNPGDVRLRQGDARSVHV